MKRHLFNIVLFSAVAGLLWACNDEDDLSLDANGAPTDLTLSANVADDGSGVVQFSASAKGVMVYHYYSGVAGEAPTVSSDGSLTYSYRSTGQYLARVVAYGPGGTSSAKSVEIDVQVDFEPPAEIVAAMTGGSSKNWVMDRNVAGHFGLGPNNETAAGGNPEALTTTFWYAAAPNEREANTPCFYDDVISFTDDGNGTTVTMEYVEGGEEFTIRGAAVPSVLGEADPGDDICFDYSNAGPFTVNFFPADPEVADAGGTTTGVSMLINGGGTFSFVVGSSTYELLVADEDELFVRVEQPGSDFAWYERWIPEDDAGGGGDNEFELLWEDNFDVDGAPDDSIWTYDIGRGQDGWGNNEAQYYTDRADNVVVSDGSLIITAKAENFGGAAYTSARLKTQDLQEFTYGRVEVRAILPQGGGTWPAIWMLGADFDVIGWPACGEIDIMEHVGNDPGRVQAALHNNSGFGNTPYVSSTTVPTADSEFHVYACEWDEEKISFFVDDQLYYTYQPQTYNEDTWPFDDDFFIILNVAMGGTLGGDIAPGFVEGTMEIDYVRVYELVQ